jgi:hypothetical protein
MDINNWSRLKLQYNKDWKKPTAQSRLEYENATPIKDRLVDRSYDSSLYSELPVKNPFDR